MATPLDLLRPITLPASLLAICHNPADSDYLAFSANIGATMWGRVAGLPVKAQPWPDAGLFDAVLLPIPANRETLSFCLAAAASRLHETGTLYVYGLNDAGIKSVDKALAVYFKDIELLGIGGHGRLYAARQPIRTDYVLADFETRNQLPMPQGAVSMVSYPGLFAKGKLDKATAFLLEHLPDVKPGTSVLDFACGIGVIGKAMQMRQDINLTVVDNDALALKAAALNLSHAAIQCCRTPAAITGSFETILSNPPIHDGQTLDYSVVEALLDEVPRLLTPGGEAYIVAQVTVPVLRFAAHRKLAATEVAANKSFRVTKVSR